MTTPAIENIVSIYPNCKITIFGSLVSIKLFVNHPNVHKIIVDDSKQQTNRYLSLYKKAKNSGDFDIALSFRKNFTTKFLLFFIISKNKYIYRRYTKNEKHQVIRYNDFINNNFNTNTKPANLKIYLKNNYKNTNKSKPLLGINPGATYGSAKRWYPKEFAKVAIGLYKEYDIIIFGGPNEKDIAFDLERELIKSNVKNYINLSGKTTIEELMINISNLDLLITADSGPMHVASAFNIPTVSLFGPTKPNETNQWNNQKSIIIKKKFSCMPCMKRVCHLKNDQNHQCMKSITSKEVLNKIYDTILF